MRITLLIAVILTLAAVTTAQTKSSTPHAPSSPGQITPEHKTVIDNWLKKKAGLRLAAEKDANTEGLKFYRQDWGSDFNPFYAVGDFNRDGRKDFAVLLVFLTKKKVDYEYAIAIFNAPFGPNKRPNYFERGYIGIDTSYIIYNKMEHRRLFLGIYEGDRYCVTFYPRRNGYFFKDCME